MRRPVAPRRMTPIRVIIVLNLTLIALLYAFIQWRFSSPEQALRLGAAFADTTEIDLKSKTSSLETMAQQGLARDQQMRKLAPPVDWEAVAKQGAEKLEAAWEATQDKVWYKQLGYHIAYPGEDPPYPFQCVNYVDGRDTGIMMVIAPFYDTNYYRAEAARALFWRLKAKGHILVGITSYQEYPGEIVNPYDDRHVAPQDAVIHNAMDAWLHCFREPDKVLPPGIPRLLLSESDFYDPDRNDGGGTLIPSNEIKKEFDLVLSNQGGEWNDFARNWTLARTAITNLINELDLKVLLLGRELKDESDKALQPFVDSGHLKVLPPGRQWKDFLKLLQSARALFVPNVHDASPRVVAEALCLDVPVVINTHILGGWKYVDRRTGEFFSNADDVVDAFRRLRSPDRAAQLSPREWYKSTWGKTRSAYKLQAFMEAAVGEDRLKAVQRDLELFRSKRSSR